MNDRVYLVGAEDVLRAGRNIEGAAETMTRAASTIDNALERHAQRIEEESMRAAQCNPEARTLRDYFAARAPFTLSDAILAADLESESPSVEVALARVIHSPTKRAVAMAKLAALRLEYADAAVKARQS